MREIEFRAKTVDDKWHYGFPQIYSDGSFDFYEPIKEYVSDIYTSEHFREVYKECKKETLGQYTGLKDKNGKKIYEGDIVKDCENHIYCAIWQESGFFIEDKIGNEIEPTQIKIKDFECEVIGNIYDNPELVEDRDD